MLVLALAFVALAATESATIAPSNDLAAIEAASRAFSRAFVEGDTTTLGELYTEDCVLVPPGRTLRGRAAAVRWFAPRPGRATLEHAMDSAEIRLDGDVAFDVGIWRQVWKRGEDSGENQGQYFVVWRRGSDGKWRIEYDMWHRPGD